MIPRTRPQGTNWKQSLRDAITTPDALLEALHLPKSEWLAGARKASRLFPLKAPLGYVRRIEKSNPHDPLLRQILPLALEDNLRQGYTNDPVGDLQATCQPGLLHKYNSRALLITTGACAIHCRYCFRRHFPYNESHSGGSNIDSILAYIQTHTELDEVILSGGDPLMLHDEALATLLYRISQIPHIRWIRLHSRLPVVLPERIDSTFLDTCKPYADKLIMVIHSNHANEIDQHVIHALDLIATLGIRLLNQSVLLKGINDNAHILSDLSQRLFTHRVQPYYLHLLDPVAGAAHFDVDESTAKFIYQEMQSQLPGYLLPRLVREIPGQPAKTLV